MSRTQNLPPTNPVVALVQAHNPAVVDRLSITAELVLGGIFDELVAGQDRRLAAGQPVSQLPLAWHALALLVGLEVDDGGRIVGGPRQPFGDF